MATEFDVWLNNKLRELNTDETVFSSYISGILDGEEESLSEKTEALEGILSEIIEVKKIKIFPILRRRNFRNHKPDGYYRE